MQYNIQNINITNVKEMAQQLTVMRKRLWIATNTIRQFQVLTFNRSMHIVLSIHFKTSYFEAIQLFPDHHAPYNMKFIIRQDALLDRHWFMVVERKQTMFEVGETAN